MAARYDDGKVNLTTTKYGLYLLGFETISNMLRVEPRLNYFHYFLKQLTGYAIHPTIGNTLRPLRIADFGTQTGIWPISLAEDLGPSARIDAFDVSDTYFPPQAWLPENVHFHLHDVYQPFHDNLLEVFDIVNIRLFMNLSTAQITAILQNAMKILKPGGYLQWTEHDKTNIQVVAISPEVSTETTKRFLELEKNPFPNYNASWVNEIATTMGYVGFQVKIEDRIKVRKSMLPQINELHLISLLDIPSGLSEAIDTFRDENFSSLRKEYENGVSTVDSFICVVGRKALE